MFDKFVYVDHTGRRFDGFENGVYLNINDMRDYSWSHDKINGRIARFYRGITTRKLPLMVMGATEAQAIETKNRLHEMAETDIAAKLPGKVYAGEYYTNGYITASKKGDYLKDKRLCKIDLTFTSDDPAWYKDETYTFGAGSKSEIGSGVGTDYNYDYPYDYAVHTTGRNIVCDAIRDSAFKMQIYGPIENPTVIINNHVYTVHGNVNAGESLLIDSLAKKITLTNTYGNTLNWFDKRSRESYIFEPIKTGKNSVTWSGTFGFDLTIIEQRSEPRWT